MQKYVPDPGIVPVSEVSPKGLEPTLSKMGDLLPASASILAPQRSHVTYL
jgi:hypothetical protein